MEKSRALELSNKLAQMITVQFAAFYQREYPKSFESGINPHAAVKSGSKWIKIDRCTNSSRSGMLMVDTTAGIVWETKAYGVPNMIPKHCKGNIEDLVANPGMWKFNGYSLNLYY